MFSTKAQTLLKLQSECPQINILPVFVVKVPGGVYRIKPSMRYLPLQRGETLLSVPHVKPRIHFVHPTQENSHRC